MTQARLEQAFARIPLLDHLQPADFSISSLAGYTNHNYRLQNARHDWVLRIPRARTNRHIDRAAEKHNQALAATLDLAPEPAWCNARGLSLTPTIIDTRTIAAAELTDSASLERILQPLVRLHRGGVKFRGRVVLGELLQCYFGLLPPVQQARFAPRLQAAHLLLAALAERDLAYVPSHNDLVLENLLLAPTRLWLIDWEFSAMASPYWDLATLCNAANLDYAQSRQLLRAYCAATAPMEESLLFDYRNLLQLLGDCWMAAFVRSP